MKDQVGFGVKRQIEFMVSITEFMSFQSSHCGLLYARELVRKFNANHLLVISSTTESLVDYKVRAISTRDISNQLIVAGFFVFLRGVTMYG